MEMKRQGKIWDLGRDNKTLLGGMKRGGSRGTQGEVGAFTATGLGKIKSPG